jgi:hypothetical protein
MPERRKPLRLVYRITLLEGADSRKSEEREPLLLSS